MFVGLHHLHHDVELNSITTRDHISGLYEEGNGKFSRPTPTSRLLDSFSFFLIQTLVSGVLYFIHHLTIRQVERLTCHRQKFHQKSRRPATLKYSCDAFRDVPMFCSWPMVDITQIYFSLPCQHNQPGYYYLVIQTRA